MQAHVEEDLYVDMYGRKDSSGWPFTEKNRREKFIDKK